MGKLIIDGNSVFEIDEDCVKKRRPVPDCDIEKYLKEDKKPQNVPKKRTVE